jgi:transcriptional regulator with XRE-family HTH domain
MVGLKVLSEYRKDRRLTRAALGEKLGVSEETIYRWEIGKRKPGKESLPVIAEITGIAPAELRPDLAELVAPSTGAAEAS